MAQARRTSAILIALGAVGCSGDADSSRAAPVDGVVLQVVPDLTDDPPDVVFAAIPDLLVTDDGQVIFAVPPEFAVQGTLVPDVWAASVSPGVVDMVRTAVDSGVPPQTIDELSGLIGPEVLDVQLYFPENFRFAAVELGPVADRDDDDETPLVEWPDTASIALADATECTRLPELEVGEVFVTAAENSAFVDDGIVYGVVAAPDWPGAPCIAPPSS